ncbi:MAG: ankyrin repeat domain-containing protein [Clostridia bacterium]|nr:ankyrin repeat domain-containing protein [Clostridia bacterium]
MLCFPYFKKRHTTQVFFDLIADEQIDEVRKLLEQGVDPNQTDVKPSWVWNLVEYAPKRPLSEACATGNLEMVKLLIQYGATAEPMKGTDWSPLMETLFYYHPDDVEMVTLLLANGADPQEYETHVAFQAAWMIPKVYDKKSTNGTVFSGEYDEETAKGITEIVKLLLADSSVDLTSRDDGGLLLWRSVACGNIALTEYLLSVGCPVTYQDRDGKTIYDLAIEKGHTEIAEMVKP